MLSSTVSAGSSHLPGSKLVVTKEGLDALKDMISGTEVGAKSEAEQSSFLQTNRAEKETSRYPDIEKSVYQKRHDLNKLNNSRMMYTMYNEKREPKVGISHALKRSSLSIIK